jgi:hypothetical protein
MMRIHVFCEGQTEETFVREILYAGLLPAGVFLNPILLRTGPAGKGGVTSYAKIRSQLVRKCREDRASRVTTMLDMYRLPRDFPGIDTLPAATDPLIKAKHLETQLEADIADDHLLANVLVHEFEGLLFSDPRAFAAWFDRIAADTIEKERKTFLSPEHVNDGPETAPSKRIKRHCAGYDKPLHGSLIAIDIGLDRIRRECRHFDAWLGRLVGVARPVG